jgi:hypothetical protein
LFWIIFYVFNCINPLVKTPIVLKPTSQNQLKSSPAFSIVLKKSSGVGCLKAQRSISSKAKSKRSGPNTCSRKITKLNLVYNKLKQY